MKKQNITVKLILHFLVNNVAVIFFGLVLLNEGISFYASKYSLVISVIWVWLILGYYFIKEVKDKQYGTLKLIGIIILLIEASNFISVTTSSRKALAPYFSLIASPLLIMTEWWILESFKYQKLLMVLTTLFYSALTFVWWTYENMNPIFFVWIPKFVYIFSFGLAISSLIMRIITW